MTEDPNELSREDAELLEQAEQQVNPTSSEVTTEDLSSDDLLANEVAPADLEQDRSGIRDFQADLAQPERRDSIEERLDQEEPDPDSDIVPTSDQLEDELPGDEEDLPLLNDED
ncbi:hypothetical protein IPV09_00040 [Tessaracoccus sp. SD287]|uniref:hypothetical protein n=1 Tax=Tessaracoccus sp. SD287 TaxID=2782008 RepID=UPI001A96C3DF|nr:hypothetical protein [Tessaracoccus sp. SD287]MBO1029725.1 hypothetical protein [Tessaracoccus sp. SD287]